jgi:hypothetical protein
MRVMWPGHGWSVYTFRWRPAPHAAAVPNSAGHASVEVVRKVRLDAARRDALIQVLAHGLIRLLARQKILVEMSDR